MTDIPAWAYKRAYNQIRSNSYSGDFLKTTYEESQSHEAGAVRAFAKYISENEEPPVPADVKRAREICAEHAFLLEKEKYLKGEFDNGLFFQAILKALREECPK